MIFHNGDNPNMTSEGILVMKVIGITVLKNILKEKEKELTGNLPIYKKDLNTSVAFQVFTNQIVVDDIKNQRLYNIDTEQISVIKSNDIDQILKVILFK